MYLQLRSIKRLVSFIFVWQMSEDLNINKAIRAFEGLYRKRIFLLNWIYYYLGILSKIIFFDKANQNISSSKFLMLSFSRTYKRFYTVMRPDDPRVSRENNKWLFQGKQATEPVGNPIM